MAAHGSVGRVVAAGAMGLRPLTVAPTFSTTLDASVFLKAGLVLGRCPPRPSEVPYVCQEPSQERRPVVLPPDAGNRELQPQVGDFPKHDLLGTAPARGVGDERDSQPARDEAQHRGLIDGLLHDARVSQAAARTR